MTINVKHLQALGVMLGLLVFSGLAGAAKNYELHQAVLDQDIDRVSVLLRKGAYPDEIGSRRYGYGSPLHLAVREGYLPIAKLLLERGATVDVLDPDDFTPLHNAAWNGNLEMTRLLLEAGADINASTYEGDTPLTLAQNNDQPKVTEFLQARLSGITTTDAPAKPTSVSDSGADDISGTYISEITVSSIGGSGPSRFTKTFMTEKNRKEITLEQTGNAISGSDGSANFKINGTREGNTINYYILRGNEIYGVWEINADATKLEGKWFTDGAGGASGTWNLTRIEDETESMASADAPVIDISGTYTNVSLTYPDRIDRYHRWYFGKGKDLQVTLEQSGDTVTGVISGDAQGEIRGVVDGNQITFEFDSVSPAGSSGYGKGAWTLSRDGSDLAGTFQQKGTSHGDFTGTWNFSKIEGESP